METEDTKDEKTVHKVLVWHGEFNYRPWNTENTNIGHAMQTFSKLCTHAEIKRLENLNRQIYPKRGPRFSLILNL